MHVYLYNTFMNGKFNWLSAINYFVLKGGYTSFCIYVHLNLYAVVDTVWVFNFEGSKGFVVFSFRKNVNMKISLQGA